MHIQSFRRPKILKPSPRVAIIGAGIGGTSCAFFLKKLFPNDISITIFEQNQVGGRMATLNIDGESYEAGASIIHPQNRYMTDFAKYLGLKQRKEHFGTWGLYDGDKIVFQTSKWTLVTISKLYWRYGWSVFKTSSFINSLLEDFSKIYESQFNALAFTTVQNLLSFMNPKFFNMTKISLASYMRDYGFSERYVDELAQSITLVNYGQDTDIGAFVGSVSMAGAESKLWSIKNGNKQVPEGLVNKSGAELIHARVSQISLLDDKTFNLSYTRLSNDHNMRNFDIVVMAAPLITKGSNPEFLNFNKDFSKFELPFQRTIATFVRGKLRKLPLTDTDKLEAIFTNKRNFMFNSLGQSYPISDVDPKETEKVYKIFSKVPLTEDQISQWFTEVNTIQSKDWMAYPKYDITDNIPPFILYPGLYYPNAIEWAASAMEMSCVGACNVASLILHNWYNRKEPIDYNENVFRDEL